MRLRPQDEAVAPPRLFPKWSKYEQDWWMEAFQSITEIMLDHQQDTPLVFKPVSEEQTDYYIDRIRLAAKLADESTKEMIYRFNRQDPIGRQAKDNGDEPPRKRARIPSRW